MVGFESESGASLYYLCIVGQWLNSLFPACGTAGKLVLARDTDSRRCARLSRGPCKPRLAGLLWLVVVACETLFVVVTVATVASHLGSPGLPGHLGPVLTSVANSGSSLWPTACFWAVSMAASPTPSHSWHSCPRKTMSLQTQPSDPDGQEGKKARTIVLPSAQPMCSQQPLSLPRPRRKADWRLPSLSAVCLLIWSSLTWPGHRCGSSLDRQGN